MKYLGCKIITGKIMVISGLHVGADKNSIEIGGMDNPIIRNPITREPYIPGSSIKGKMRALEELKLGRYSNKGTACNCGQPDCPVCRVFGSANNSKDDGAKRRGPTRIIVRDATLSPDWCQKFREGVTIVEEKSENSLNRITAEANPRPIERVVPGVTFDFEIVYRMFDPEDEEYYQSVVIDALTMLEKDFLGGGGSRGNGKIRFVDLKEDGKDLSL